LQAEGEDPEEEIHELGQDEDSEAEIDELCEDKFDIEKLVALSTASEDLFTPQVCLSPVLIAQLVFVTNASGRGSYQFRLRLF
jgi:hypothetical protein